MCVVKNVTINRDILAQILEGVTMKNFPFPVPFLEYLTLHYTILFFRSYYYAQKWRFYFRSLLALYILYIGFLLFRFGFAYYCLHKNKLELFKQWNPSIYSFMISFKKEKLMILSFFGLIIHCVNVIIYEFHYLFKYFSVQLEDLLGLGYLCIENGFTIVDCLFHFRWNLKRIQKEIYELSYLAYISTNPYMKQVDYHKLITILKVVELCFLLTTTFMLLLMTAIFPVLLYFFWSRSHVGLFTLTSVWGQIDLTLGVLGLSILGVWAPWSMVPMVYVFFRSIRFPFDRFSNGIIELYPRLPEVIEHRTLFRVMYKLQFGQKLFCYFINMSIYINRFGVKKVFAISTTANLASSVVIMIELVIGDFDYIIKAWLIVLSAFEVTIFLAGVVFLITTSESLYRPSRHYFRYMILISRQSKKIQLMNYIKLAFFLETIRPKKFWNFSLGTLGRVNRKTFYGFLPAYSALVMACLPLILNKDTDNEEN